MNNRKLYESIMSKVAKEVKKAINESYNGGGIYIYVRSKWEAPLKFSASELDEDDGYVEAGLLEKDGKTYINAAFYVSICDPAIDDNDIANAKQGDVIIDQDDIIDVVFEDVRKKSEAPHVDGVIVGYVDSEGRISEDDTDFYTNAKNIPVIATNMHFVRYKY